MRSSMAPGPAGGRTVAACAQVNLPGDTPRRRGGVGLGGLRLLRMQGAGDLRASVCPSILRWCAGAMRLRDRTAHVVLDQAVTDATGAGWRVGWRFLPRRANVAAHQQADGAARWNGRVSQGGGVRWRVTLGELWSEAVLRFGVGGDAW